MPVTLGGVASGIDTDGIIQKLVDVESQPLKKMQQEKVEYRQKIGALEEMQKRLKALEDSTKDLYGFRASYDDKKAISSNEALLEAVATKLADIGNRKIAIDQIASTHKITSDPLPTEDEIGSGTIKIQIGEESESLKFRGGTLESFRKSLDEKFSKMLKVYTLKTTGDKSVLVLESNTPGEKGEMLITGDLQFLKKIGLVSGPKDDDKKSLDLVLDNQFFQKYNGTAKSLEEDGSLIVAPDGKSVSIKGVLWREYKLPAESELTKDTYLSFSTEYTKPAPPEVEDETLPFRIEIGPTEKTVIKGIELDGYNVSRIRPLEQKPKPAVIDDKLGIGVVFEDETGRTEKLYPLNPDAKGEQQIPVGSQFEGKKIKNIIFYTNEGETKFIDPKILTPVKGKDLLQAKNEIAKGQNAKFKVDGIEVEREKNDGLSDVIKGVTLTLKGETGKVPVELKIDHDIDKAVDKIKIFVEKYNAYLELNKQLTKAAIVEEKDKFDKTKSESGIFVGDMTLMRLENSLKTTIGNPYPSQVEEPVKILSQIGVSTGKLNSAWKDISEGKLVIDEDVLRTVIMKNPEGVKNFFGSDNDGDNRTDNGMAFVLENSLKPYTSPAKNSNILTVKITEQNDSITRTNERIARQEEHLKNYEEKLRKKFGSMEQAVSSSKATQSWMNSQQGVKEQ
ncbi:MAG: flagellar filament capping protein FliD [Spirochaetes bacterium]|nr:flagellar filament capping protein FliD [Spirochaetota bacterium]